MSILFKSKIFPYEYGHIDVLSTFKPQVDKNSINTLLLSSILNEGIDNIGNEINRKYKN